MTARDVWRETGGTVERRGRVPFAVSGTRPLSQPPEEATTAKDS